MIDIKNIDGSVLFSVLPDDSAVFHEELMASDYVKLSWDSDVYQVIPAGAYIEYDGEKYKLLDNYSPSQQDECTYQYTPQFQSRVINWDKQITPVYTYEQDGKTVKSREMDWEFTGSPADAMYIVKQAIKNETGEEWTIQLAEILPATIRISSQSSSIFATLNTIAGECDTEWWADKKTNTLYLSKCIFGDAVKLEVGDNVQAPTVTNDSEGYFTRFYAFGSTRNITQDYDGGQATNHIVNKRLTLNPTKYPNGYKDIKAGLKPEEVFVKVLHFDDIYPSSKLTISDVRARLKYRLDSNGQKIKIGGTDAEPIYEQYAIWYFQIEGFTFDPSTDVIEGLNLSASFESGQLAGRDFELTYHEKATTVNDAADVTAFNIKAGDYEIVIDESSGTIIPGTSYIIPQNGDSIVLFNIVMPDEYVTSAQDELEKALDKAMLSYTEDNNSYQMASDPTRFYESGTDIQMGQAVTFVNGSKSLSTRVQMIEKRLDLSCYQTIKVGNKIIKGNTQQLKDEVANVNQNLDVIKAFNELSSSLSQAYANAQREMIEGFAAIKKLWTLETDEQGNKYAYTQYDVFGKGGITAYTAGKAQVPSIFDGLPLDNVTIWKNPSTGLIEVIGGTVGGGSDFDASKMWSLLGASTNEQINKSHITTALSGYATESWVTSKNYAVKATTLAGYGITDAYTKTESDNKYLLKSSYTATDVLNKLKTVDGSGSGLDADLLDGIHANGLLTAITSNATTNLSLTVGGTTKTISDLYATQAVNSDTVDNYHAIGTSGNVIRKRGHTVSSTTAAWCRLAKYSISNTEVLTDVSFILHSSLNGIFCILNIESRGVEYIRGKIVLSYRMDISKIRIYYDDAKKNVELYYLAGEYYSVITAELLYSTDRNGVWNNNITMYELNTTSPSYTNYINPSISSLQNNVASATKLQTPRTLWGRSFDGTANVSGQLDGVTNINGTGTFTSANTKVTDSIFINGIRLHKSQDGVIKLEGNLAVTGGITSYAVDEVQIPTIMDGVVVDGTTIVKENGKLVVKNAGGGEAGSVAWGNITGKPSTFPTNIAGISDLHSSWDSLLKAEPSAYVTRWPSISEVTNKKNLIVKLNGGTTEGTNQFTYNATAAKTINITPSSIGAYTKSEADDKYLLKTSYTAADVLNKLKTVDGSGSGLDADTLDGKHNGEVNGFLNTRGLPYTNNDKVGWWCKIANIKITDQYTSKQSLLLITDSYTTNPSSVYGFVYIKVQQQSSIGNSPNVTLRVFGSIPKSNIEGRLTLTSTSSDLDIYFKETLYFQRGYISFVQGEDIRNVGELIQKLPTATHNILCDNDFRAGRLETYRTIWGREFDGTANVSGDMTGVGSITANGVLNITGESNYSEGIRLHKAGEISSLWFNAISNSGFDSGMWGITADSTGLRFRYGTGTAPNDLFKILNNGNIGIGTTSPSQKLNVSGNILATGGVTCYSSDARAKTIIEELNLSLKQISESPTIRFKWNGWKIKDDGKTHIGGIAQYVQKLLPECVLDTDDFLNLDYSTTAYIYSVQTARHLRKYETKTDKEIMNLKKRIVYLENKLKKLGYEESDTLAN